MGASANKEVKKEELNELPNKLKKELAKYIKDEVIIGPRFIPIDFIDKVKKAVCKIKIQTIDKIAFGTGFFLNYSDSKKFIITCFHVINPTLENEKIEIEIYNKKIMKLNLNNTYIKYFDKPKDITIIEIKQSEEIYKDIEYLKYDLNYINDGYSIYKNVDIFSIHYPYGEVASCSSGKILDIDNHEFEHDMATDNGSSGCPILLLNNNISLIRVIGIHKEGINIENRKINFGTFLGEIINKELKNNNNYIISGINFKEEDENLNKNLRIINPYEKYLNKVNDKVKLTGSSNKKSNSQNKIIEKEELCEKDKSYISSIIQVFYNIKIFRDYFINNEYNENPNKHLSILMRKIISKPLNEIDFLEEGNEIKKLLRTKYDFIVGKKPGDIIIQILLVLKYEEKEIITNNWEECIYNESELFKNISNREKALSDLLKININHYNTLFSAMFFGIFCAERKLSRMKEILYFYNFYCAYEINLPQIYENMINKGKIILDELRFPKIELIDCINLMQETQNELFKGEYCFSEYYMFYAPKILIILLKSEDPFIKTPFRGIITFEEYLDFSKLNNTKMYEPKRFKLISVINKSKFLPKKYKNEVAQYKSIFRNENDKFCEYGKENSVKNCKLEINDADYQHEILIFMRY